MYVISLHASGYAFQRQNEQQKRDLVLRLGWAIASAVIAFLVGVILKSIF
jgi:cytochrome bd-type quinol oxidase subunit 2